MTKNKKCVAMLLAGGQGSRLFALTSKIAKPAVAFGSKYRIIDFPLSNCISSGIDTVGVLTQYQPLVLNEYIGNGQPWDLDRNFGGVHILPPYQAKDSMEWYKGTANAIYQNIHFLKKYNPDFVLILSGDHIYQMNYDEMLEFHVKHNASCTIAVLEVPLAEASRFGILETAENGYSIKKFEEKPKKPKSTKASMGIYIFNANTLYKYLEEDENDKTSSNDFGKNIIVNMLKSGENMVAFPFEGYWKDVGTISSLWEANMDLLGDKPSFDINNLRRKIISRSESETAHYVASGAVVKNSMIAGGSEIYGKVENSIIGRGVIVEKGAVVKDAVIHQNVSIGKNSKIIYSIIDDNVTIGENVTIGKPKADGVSIAVVGRNVTIGNDSIVTDTANVEEDVLGGAKV